MTGTISQHTVIPPYNTTTGLVYILELNYAAGGTIPLAHSDLGTVAGRAVAAFREFYSATTPAGGTPPLSYFATEDFASGPLDSVAPNRWYDGRLNRAGVVGRSIVLTAVDGSSYSTALGTIELANGDGALDVLPDVTTFVNSRAQIKVGQRGTALSTFQTLATGIVMGVDVSLDTATIELGGIETLLEKPWFNQTYAGTGGIEGPASLEGTAKPYVMGTVFNMAPTLIEPLTYIFQAHAGALASFDKVDYGGVDFLFDADYPTYAALAASAPATGHYTTCLAFGLTKVGLTAGGTGNFALTVSVSTAAGTASVLARQVADAALANLGVEYDTTAFDLMQVQDSPFVYGRLLTESTTYTDVLTDLMRNMNRYWGINRAGLLTTARLDLPGASPSSGLVWNNADILEADRLALPEGFRWPHDQRTVRYRKNWSPQTNLAAIVTDPSYSTDYLSYTLDPPGTPTNALTPENVDSNLRAKAGADLLAQRLLNLHGAQRFMYSIKASILSGVPSLLETVIVTYDRFDLDSGRTLVVVASTEDYDDGTVLLTLWG